MLKIRFHRFFYDWNGFCFKRYNKNIISWWHSILFGTNPFSPKITKQIKSSFFSFQHFVCRHCGLHSHLVNLLCSRLGENPERTICTLRSAGRGEFRIKFTFNVKGKLEASEKSILGWKTRWAFAIKIFFLFSIFGAMGIESLLNCLQHVWC